MSDVPNDEPGPGAPEGSPAEGATPVEPAVEAAPSAVGAEAVEEGEPGLAEEAPAQPRHFTAPALIPLDHLEDDPRFLVRPEAELEDVAALATDLARLGQLFPIDVRLVAPDRFQVVTGFRRVAALRLLQRERVLARLHTDLGDADAQLMALAAAVHSRGVAPADLAALRDRLEAEGRLSPAARDMFEKALGAEGGLGPEEVEEEVDADELAGDAAVRLGELNQDLALLADVYAELDPGRREQLLQQLRYAAELVAFLEGRR